MTLNSIMFLQWGHFRKFAWVLLGQISDRGQVVIWSDVYAVILWSMKMPMSKICHTVLYVHIFPSFLLIFVSLCHSFEFVLPHLPQSFLYFTVSLSFCHVIVLFLSFSHSTVCLSLSKCILMCSCTITKPACLFILHRGFTLFLCYYFFVKSPLYDLPQTALHCPTLIIFSHSATLGHNDTHAHTFSHKTMCVFVLSWHWFLGVFKNGKLSVYFLPFLSGIFTALAQMKQ